jgi:alpha-tubulin suppressor-like RCC1 family protein
VAIAAGGAHSLALKSDGTVWAWGYNGYGQLGDGTTSSRSLPVPVSGLSGVTAIAAGNNGYITTHSLALKSDGTVWAWGYNNYGQLGDNSTTARNSPTQVLSAVGQPFTSVTAIAAGGGHSLALKADGTAWAWGYNYYGQLGDGSTTARGLPVQLPGLTGVTAIAAGDNHSLAASTDGTEWAWGSGGHGRLGNGLSTNASAPSRVASLLGTAMP